MPIPSPRENEKETAFIQRCMGNDIMLDEFPKETQRSAVCHQKWDDKDKRSDTMNKTTIERRFSLNTQQLELREADNGLPKIVGYAATFGARSSDLGGFKEEIRSGAFKRSLGEKADVVALFNHDNSAILGRTPKTLSLSEDATGLRFELQLSDTSLGRDTAANVSAGNLKGMSFAFHAKQDEWRKEDGKDVRTLVDVDLVDISIATRSAYSDTSVAVRSLELHAKAEAEAEAEAEVGIEAEAQKVAEQEGRDALQLARAKLRLMDVE